VVDNGEGEEKTEGEKFCTIKGKPFETREAVVVSEIEKGDRTKS